MGSRNPFEAITLIVAIAQEGSFQRAAKVLGIGAASLTRKVSAIEKDLGVEFFDRTTRKVELTRAGRLFVQEATISLDHAERAWELARHQALLEHGPYRVGYSPDTNSAFLLLLNNLKPTENEMPGIDLESANTADLVERVLRNKIHVAIATGPIIDEDLWVQPIGREGFSICMSRQHRLATKAFVNVHDLDGEILFWMPRSIQPQFYRMVTRYMRSKGVRPIFREARAITHIMEFVAQGIGIAMLPRSASRLSRPGVVFKTLTDRYLGIESVLLMRRDQRYGYLKELIDGLLSQLLSLKITIN